MKKRYPLAAYYKRRKRHGGFRPGNGIPAKRKFLAAAAITVALIFYYWAAIVPTVTHSVEKYGADRLSTIINEVVTENTDLQADVDKMVRSAVRSPDGGLALTVNKAYMQTLSANLSAAITRRFDSDQDVVVRLRSGAFSGLPFLAGAGWEVKVGLVSSDDAIAVLKYENSVKTGSRFVLDVKLYAKINSPLTSGEQRIDLQIPIYETLTIAEN